ARVAPVGPESDQEERHSSPAEQVPSVDCQLHMESADIDRPCSDSSTRVHDALAVVNGEEPDSPRSYVPPDGLPRRRSGLRLRIDDIRNAPSIRYSWHRFSARAERSED